LSAAEPVVPRISRLEMYASMCRFTNPPFVKRRGIVAYDRARSLEHMLFTLLTSPKNKVQQNGLLG